MIYNVWYNVFVPKIAVFYNQKMLWEYSEWRALAFQCSVNEFFNELMIPKPSKKYTVISFFRG